MPNATARYVITADDNTKAAIASVKRGFEGLDKASRKLSQGLKGIGVGALALKAWGIAARAGDEAIRNLADSNAQFAASLRETDKAMTGLWIAGEHTIETQAKLAVALKDPTVQGAVSGLADRFGQLRLEIKALLPAWALLLQHGTDTKRVFDELAKVKPVGPQSRGSVRDLGDVELARKIGAGQNAAFDKRFADQAKQAAASARAAVADVLPPLNLSLNARAAELVGGMKLDDFGDAIIESTEGIAERMSETLKEPFAELTPYAADVARGLDGAFADFFRNADGGFKGLAKSIVQTFGDLLAQIAAVKLRLAIFGNVDDKGNLSGGLLSGFVNGLFDGFGGAKAAGGPVSAGMSYLVGERGPELFTPRGSGHITPNHAMGGVVQNITVDARGATVDAIRAIPAAMAEAKRQAVAEVQELVRRGRL